VENGHGRSATVLIKGPHAYVFTVKAIGFNPSSIAAEQRATTRVMRSIDITRAVEGDIADSNGKPVGHITVTLPDQST
jgi:hypothetical protein